LPDSLEEFSCRANKKRDAKVKAIYKLFSNEKGRVETDG
jgi:hypothetical protein